MGSRFVCESNVLWDANNCIHDTAPSLDHLFVGQGVSDMVEYVNDTFKTCGVVPSARNVEYACKFGTTAAMQILASELHLMAKCFVPLEDENATSLTDAPGFIIF